jgi:hypothetical protein
MLLHNEKIPLGVIFEGNRPTYEDLRPTNSREPIALQSLQGIDYAAVMEEFF